MNVVKNNDVDYVSNQNYLIMTQKWVLLRQKRKSDRTQLTIYTKYKEKWLIWKSTDCAKPDD